MEKLQDPAVETNTATAEKRKSLRDRAADMFSRVLASVGIVDAPAGHFKDESKAPVKNAELPSSVGLFPDRADFIGEEPVHPARQQHAFRKPQEGLFGGEAIRTGSQEQPLHIQRAFDPHGDFVKPEVKPGHYAPSENPFAAPGDQDLYE